MVDPNAAAAACARGDGRGTGGLQGGLEAAVAEAKAAHPDRPVEVWAEDEHRLGLKPVRRRVWAPIGQRPVALGHHRYQWLHVIAFVQPTSGETVWYLSSGLSKPFFAELLAAFARQTGAGRDRSIVLALDNAGWHGPEGLAVPDGISLAFLPPYSPEVQPAERLWALVDEPIVNRHVASLAELDAIIAERCRRLEAASIKPHTDFHWWPRPTNPN
jgi:transposase